MCVLRLSDARPTRLPGKPRDAGPGTPCLYEGRKKGPGLACAPRAHREKAQHASARPPLNSPLSLSRLGNAPPAGRPRTSPHSTSHNLFTHTRTNSKTQCDLAVSRIRLLRNKRQIRLKAARREVADLLRAGKTESARIRVEALLRDGSLLAAFDILELHAELLGVRAAVIERHDARSGGVPPDMVECVSSLAYAAVRVGAELPELPVISAQLRKKFGREWEAEAADDATRARWHVNEALARALAIEVPPPSSRLACLASVAAEHGVAGLVAAG